MKKIEIMGCGYIGLPTAITFTLAGYEVCGFDVKDSVVETLNAGHIHIVEPGLQDAMTKAMNTGRLHFMFQFLSHRQFVLQNIHLEKFLEYPQIY